MKVGGGGGEGRKLPHPLLALLLTPYFAQSLTLIPCSLLPNRTEMLATQATSLLIKNSLSIRRFWGKGGKWKRKRERAAKKSSLLLTI